MKVVVSGASGLLGSALVPALRGAGHDVIRLVRRESKAADEAAWDPDGGTIESERLQGVDAAINLSGESIGQRWTESRKREILDSRVSTMDLLARTLATLEPRPSVLLGSGGSGIYGNRGDEILTEDSATDGGFLAEVAKAWEAAAAPAAEAGIRVVSFRQGIVLTKEGGALDRMLTPFKLGVGGPIGSGKQWLAWVALDDLVSAYLFALDSRLEGPVNLVGPNPTTNRQFVKALGRALHRPAVMPLPAFAVKVMFGQMGEETLLQGQRMLPTKLLDAGFTFAYPEVDAALERALEE